MRPTLTSTEILAALAQHRAELRALGVHRLGLFGSYRRGEQNAESDLDFLVELEQQTFDRYMEVKFYLEDLFERPVDLVMPDTIKPRLRPIILGEVLYAAGL